MNPQKESHDFSAVAAGFLNKVKDNPTIGPTHISLFLAILASAEGQALEKPISVFSKNLMRLGKISGIATYHKCIQELQELAVIRYEPSYNPVIGSLIYLERQKLPSK